MIRLLWLLQSLGEKGLPSYRTVETCLLTLNLVVVRFKKIIPPLPYIMFPRALYCTLFREFDSDVIFCVCNKAEHAVRIFLAYQIHT